MASEDTRERERASSFILDWYERIMKAAGISSGEVTSPALNVIIQTPRDSEVLEEALQERGA